MKVLIVTCVLGVKRVSLFYSSYLKFKKEDNNNIKY